MGTSAIEKFLERYDRAVQGRSKEMRLQMDEAKNLSHEIAMLLARTGTLSDKVIELQEQLINEKDKQPSDAVSVDMDGGGF